MARGSTYWIPEKFDAQQFMDALAYIETLPRKNGAGSQGSAIHHLMDALEYNQPEPVMKWLKEQNSAEYRILGEQDLEKQAQCAKVDKENRKRYKGAILTGALLGAIAGVVLKKAFADDAPQIEAAQPPQVQTITEQRPKPF